LSVNPLAERPAISRVFLFLVNPLAERPATSRIKVSAHQPFGHSYNIIKTGEQSIREKQGKQDRIR